MTNSYFEAQENVELTQEELEKQKKQDLEDYAKAKHFKALIETPEWKECEKVLRNDIYMNLHYQEQHLHMCWGIKMTIDRIKAWADYAVEILKRNGGSI